MTRGWGKKPPPMQYELEIAELKERIVLLEKLVKLRDQQKQQ